MKLTHDNYYSAEADREYMSNSQLKAWLECPRRQWAKLNGQWEEEEPMAFLVGKYVDQWLLTPGTADEFCDANKEALYTKTGKPRAEIELADRMIERAERDDLFMGSLDGETQKLITWEMFGIKWRALFDAVDYGRGTLVDLKTVKDFEPVWCDKTRVRLPFYERYGYWTQLAIYREAYKSKAGEYPKVTAIAAVSKHKFPRLKVIQFDNDDRFQHELEQIEMNLPDILKWREALSLDDAPKCGKCDYCADRIESIMEMAESLKW